MHQPKPSQNPEVIQVVKRNASIAIQKSATSDFDAQFVMSAATLDRTSDTINPKAYKKAIAGVDKLIALFNHDHDKIIGYWSNLKTVGDTLTGHIRFFPEDWGAMVKKMLDFGIPLGASIGFQGKAKANDHGGLHFEELSLLETSVVAVPANQRAIQIAKSFGFELPDATEILPYESPRTISPNTVISNAKAAILRANKTVRLKP